jgi:hypothetical protein
MSCVSITVTSITGRLIGAPVPALVCSTRRFYGHGAPRSVNHRCMSASLGALALRIRGASAGTKLSSRNDVGRGVSISHVGERRTNTAVHSAAESIAREGVRHGTEVRSGLNDPASRNVCCESWASSILAHTMVSSERIILPAGFASPSSAMRRR